jgi:hypothetical protein
MSKYTFLVFLLSALFLNCSFNIKKGCSGSYFIAGKAFYKKKTFIKNESIQIVFGDKKFDTQTSEHGDFEIEINWKNTCRSSSSKIEHLKRNEYYNPRKITFSYKNKTLTFDNEWKKYGKCGVSNKKELTNKKDLYFN